MPHYKCEACRTRCQIPGAPNDLVGDLCPGCGSLLEPAGELASLVGFRWSTPSETPPVSYEPPKPDDELSAAMALPRPNPNL
jgi:hypothetical protein